MGSWFSASLPEDVRKDIHDLHQETGFSEFQIRRLYARFVRLDRDKKNYLIRKDLILIPELAVNPLASKIIDAFLTIEGSTDPEDDNSYRCNFKQFVHTMARFQRNTHSNQSTHPLSTEEKKIEFMFKVYDTDRDGKISRGDLANILRSLLANTVHKEQLDCIITRAMAEADQDLDSCIDFEEFKQTLGSIDVNDTMSVRFP